MFFPSPCDERQPRVLLFLPLVREGHFNPQLLPKGCCRATTHRAHANQGQWQGAGCHWRQIFLSISSLKSGHNLSAIILAALRQSRDLGKMGLSYQSLLLYICQNLIWRDAEEAGTVNLKGPQAGRDGICMAALSIIPADSGQGAAAAAAAEGELSAL